MDVYLVSVERAIERLCRALPRAKAKLSREIILFDLQSLIELRGDLAVIEFIRPVVSP
jgi:hypothetical protein